MPTAPQQAKAAYCPPPLRAAEHIDHIRKPRQLTGKALAQLCRILTALAEVKKAVPAVNREIQSETEPYGLTVFLKDEPSAVKLEDELQVNADMTFDLIGNLGTIDYKTADSKEIIVSYER